MGFIASLFSSPRSSAAIPALQPVIPAPTADNAAAEAARQKAAEDQRRAASLAKGRASTILTSGEGVTGKAPVKLKQLLGE